MKLRMMIHGLAVCCILIWATQRGVSNNVKLTGAVEVTDITDGMATLELRLSWENSWRDSFNWDAVWIFLKLKSAGGEWKPVYLMNEGHEATNGYLVMNGKSGANITGVYVYAGSKGENPNVSTKVTLKWACGTAYTKETFDRNQAFLQAHAIEMVYVPYGVYYLGDGYSQNSFCDAEGNSCLVSSEEALSLSQLQTRNSVSSVKINLAATYPKGYKGFYVMKYEVSQEQYVAFLNTLTRVQQESLLGASRLQELNAGDYLFGKPDSPSYRNGIVLSAKPEGLPYTFENDLNRNGVYGEDGDGQCVACNYLSVSDLQAYAGWSGLRPMTELEYERACRIAYPQTATAGEYAWNNAGGVVAATTIGRSGAEEEYTDVAANVNTGNRLDGPLRCGIFARASSGQQLAGATYWGVMEMSGNLREMVANTDCAGIRNDLNGEGTFTMDKWGAVPAHYGVRGGSFAAADSLLRVSDRSEVKGYFTLVNQRDSTVGFRLVQTIDNGDITVSSGEITMSAPLCRDVETTVSESVPATVPGVSEMDFTYAWYVKEGTKDFVLLPGEVRNTLKYKNFSPETVYQFKRKVLCSLGEAEAVTPAVTSSVPITITTQPQPQEAACSLALSITATGDGLSYQWQKNEADISGATAATYTKSSTEREDAGIYRCLLTGTCGYLFSDAVSVTVPFASEEVGILVDPRDGQTYRTRLMPDGHEWMIDNLRFGTCDETTFRTYSAKSTLNQIAVGYYGVCIKSTIEGGGNLYNWQAAMNHPDAKFGSSINPSGNISGNNPTQWQGICPEGWHLPSGGVDGEFDILYKALCQQKPRMYPGIGWFEASLTGWYTNTYKYSEVNSQVRYSSSTPDGMGPASTTNTNNVFNLYLGISGDVFVAPKHYNLLKATGAPVRCVKDYEN